MVSLNFPNTHTQRGLGGEGERERRREEVGEREKERGGESLVGCGEASHFNKKLIAY